MRRRALLMGGKSKPFISVWKTDNTDADSTANNQVKLPLSVGATPLINAVKVDWGDGSKTNIPVGTPYTSPLLTHTYPSVGIYTIKIYGLINQWQWTLGYLVDRRKILTVTQWGGFKPTDRDGLFRTCLNLNIPSTTDDLDLSNCTNLKYGFNFNNSLTYLDKVENWNVSTITTLGLERLFHTTNFNQDISAWNFPLATSLEGMFNSNAAFNQDLSAWASKIANITNMSNMFNGATGFNKDLSGWVPNMHLNVNLVNFMAGKAAANYNYQYVDNFLIAMASRSWAGRTQAKTISFGTCQRSTNSTTAYNTLISDGWTITLSATVITP